MTNLYTEEDIKQWKEGNQRIADILQRKASSYVPGDRYPKQLSMQYLDEAFVSLAEKDGPRFLALVRASVACDCLLWKSAINHRSKPETLETIQQMGVGPIVTALLISQELGRETAELFFKLPVPFHKRTNLLAKLLHRLCCGAIAENSPLKNVHNNEVSTIATALYYRDETKLTESIFKGAEKWRRYVLQDKGHPDSVCYLIGLAFTRLSRELWLPNFAVNHFLIPDFVLSCHATEEIQIDLPF